MGGRVIRVENVSHNTSLYQLEKFFNYIGHIDDIKIYPSENSQIPVESKICFVKYRNSDEAYLASCLNGTTFIDRMLVITVFNEDRIPSEERGLEMAGAHTSQPIPVPGAVQMVNPAFDPDLAQLGLPQPPPLPASLDAVTIERIRRTIYVSNINPSRASADNVLEYFNQIGPVNYVALAQGDMGDSFEEKCAAYIEFASRTSVLPALKLNETEYEGSIIGVSHSGTQIDAPLFPSGSIAKSELKLAAKQYKDAEFIVRVFIEPDKVPLNRSRSPSPVIRHKSISIKKEERSSRSRDSKSRRRSRSRSDHRSRRRSDSRKRSSRHSSRYRSRSKKRRSRSRDREKDKDRRSSRRRSRTPKDHPKDSSKKERKRSRSSSVKKKDRHRSKRSSSRDRGRSKKDDHSEKDRKRKKSRSRKRSSSKQKRKRSRSRKKDRNTENDHKTNEKSSSSVKLNYDDQEKQQEQQINCTNNANDAASSSNFEAKDSDDAASATSSIQVKEEYLDSEQQSDPPDNGVATKQDDIKQNSPINIKAESDDLDDKKSAECTNAVTENGHA